MWILNAFRVVMILLVYPEPDFQPFGNSGTGFGSNKKLIHDNSSVNFAQPCTPTEPCNATALPDCRHSPFEYKGVRGRVGDMAGELFDKGWWKVEN